MKGSAGEARRHGWGWLVHSAVRAGSARQVMIPPTVSKPGREQDVRLVLGPLIPLRITRTVASPP